MIILKAYTAFHSAYFYVLYENKRIVHLCMEFPVWIASGAAADLCEVLFPYY